MVAGVPAGPGMQNVFANANFAVNQAAWAEQQARLAVHSCEALARAKAKSERWARDLKINQVKTRFDAPGDKKEDKAMPMQMFDNTTYSFELNNNIASTSVPNT